MLSDCTLRVGRFCAALVLLAAISPVSAHAQSSKPRTAVVLGDSFASGEGGRWKGNSFTGIDSGDRAKTDRAAFLKVGGGWGYDTSRAYDRGSISNGCHRSSDSLISYLQKDGLGLGTFDKAINLACSGAHTKHLWPVTDGGFTFKGESPQITRLAQVAAVNDIDLIVLGVGGNDVGFSRVIERCVKAWMGKHTALTYDESCIQQIQDSHVSKIDDMVFNLRKTIKLVNLTMLEAGDEAYRIVLLGAPNIIPRASEFSYPAGMRRIRNCPFNGPDADFVDEVLVPKLNAAMEAVADLEDVDFINLHHSFDGHRLCESSLGERMTGVQLPSSENTEWVRYLDSTLLEDNALVALIGEWAGFVDGTKAATIAGDQGSLSESLHPNHYGQAALGQCVLKYTQIALGASKGYQCTGGASGRASDMNVSALPVPPSLSIGRRDIPDQGRIIIHKALNGSPQPGQVMRVHIQAVHPKKGHLRLSMRSPSGAEYLIKDFNPTDHGSFPSSWVSFFEQAPAEVGTWSLTVEDATSGTTGSILAWSAFYY